MTNPFFSIIIPTFNSEKTIYRCLESILSQSFSNFEVLIIDGESSDETISIAKFFKDAPIKIFSEKDTGIYDAMNKGIRFAKGKWLYFLGANDELFNEYVLQNVANKIRDTDAEFIYGNVRIIGRVPEINEGIYDGMFDIKKLFKKNICHQSIFYAETVFDKVGFFNTNYVIRADWDLNHRCFANLKVEYIAEIIAKFEWGGLSSTGGTDKYEIENIFKLKSYYQISYFDSKFRNYSWIFYYHANKAAENRMFFKAFNFLLFSYIHSNDKVLLTKSYLINIIKYVKSFFKKSH